MLKYVDLRVDNYLIPMESTMVLTLSNASNRQGIPLFIKELERILNAHPDVTCVAFKGADHKPALITYWSNFVFKHFKNMKIAWVSEGTAVPHCLPLQKMDYIKLQDDLYRRDYKSTKKTFKNAWYLVERY